jgi:GT2 family glycosyltransferase
MTTGDVTMHPEATLDRGNVSVSALVVNYHAYGELGACLTSLAQQHTPLEVIVVDHETIDERRRMLEQQHPSVRWIPRAENPGFAAGVNLAARHATGRYLYLVNPDALVAPNTSTVLAAWLDEHVRVGVVGSKVLDPDGSIQASARRFPGASTAFGGRTSWLTRRFPANPVTRRNLLVGSHVSAPIEVDWVSGASMMVRRRAFDAVGGMDEGFFLYWEDADLCKRLRDAGWTTAYHPGSTITHLCGRSSCNSARSTVAFHRSAYRYFRKHSGAVGLLAAPIAFAGLSLRLGMKLLVRRPDRAERMLQ